ncbi:MAG: hypothetical protein RR325_03440 [Bacilli bacterium]
MNYIYDVIVNLNNMLVDFFEWNKSDSINHLRKTPLIKVDTNTLFDLTYNKVKVSLDLLKSIENKTETYNNRDLDYLNFTAIFTDTNINVCIKFNKEGINVLKSFLQSEENEEIDEFSQKINAVKIDYIVIDNKRNLHFKTRRELLIDNYVLKNIKLLEKNDDIERLKYIYYDCFNKYIDNKQTILNEIYFEIKNNSFISNKISNFFKLTSVKNN